MSSTLSPSPAQAQVAYQRHLFNKTMGHLLATFAAVPEDKLHWQPTPTAKSAFQVAAHVAASNEFFVACLQGNPPATDFGAAMVWIDARAAEYTTREELTNTLQATRTQLDTIMQNIPDQMIENPEVAMILEITAYHPESHAAQIDLLQTCWGDMEFYFGDH